MQILVTDLKGRRKAREPRLSKGVVYRFRLLIIEIVKQFVVLSLTGSLSLIAV